jgi:hypothetical protein
MIETPAIVFGSSQDHIELRKPFSFQPLVVRRKPARRPGRRPAGRASVGSRQLTLDVVQIEHQTVAAGSQESGIGRTPKMLDDSHGIPSAKSRGQLSLIAGETVKQRRAASRQADRVSPNASRRALRMRTERKRGDLNVVLML